MCTKLETKLHYNKNILFWVAHLPLLFMCLLKRKEGKKIIFHATQGYILHTYWTQIKNFLGNLEKCEILCDMI